MRHLGVRVLGIAFVALLGGCSFAIENRSIAAIGAVRAKGTPRPSYRDLENLLDDVVARLQTAGFKYVAARHRDKRYDYVYHLTGERLYTDSFPTESARNVRCYIELDARKARLRFYEMVDGSYSHTYPATDAQREEVRALARSLAAYLRTRAPAPYEVSVTYDEHAY